VLVDFWAEWCPPCKAMVPDLEAVASQYAGRARVGKASREWQQATAIIERFFAPRSTT